MKNFCLSLALLLGLRATAVAQAPAASPNLDFERLDRQLGRPAGLSAPAGNGYQVAADSLVRHGGRYALRIRSESQEPKKNGFGVTTIRVPVSFQGKTVKLTGFLKTENVQNGYAGLWLRVDGPGIMLGLDNMSKQNVHGTTNWQAYSVSLPLAANAEIILLGGLLPGTGTVWLDDLTLTVDDKPLAQALPKPVKHYRAEQDTAFSRGSGIALDKLTKQQVDNLAVLG